MPDTSLKSSSPAQPSDSLTSKAKAVVPPTLKEALRPLAARLGLANAEPAGLAHTDEGLLELTHPSVNAHTIKLGGRTHKFFFLCGCWRSGTHWTARVLNLHPDINIVGEFQWQYLIKALGRHTASDGGVGGWYQGSKPVQQQIAREGIQTIIRRSIYAATCNKRTATFIGDHSPRMLQEALPGAPNILVVRDGRDVLVSQAFHSMRVDRLDWFRPRFRPFAQKHMDAFKANPEAMKKPGVGFLSEDYWVRTQAREWAEHVRHDLAAKQQFIAAGTPVHLVRYEDLHRDFERQRAAMYRFFGLDPSLAAQASEETKTSPGFKQETVTSDNRKGIVGDWMNYFDDRCRRIYREEAGDVLIELGYEKDRNW